jgi:Fic family protein
MYIHERKNWPCFTWNDAQLLSLLAEVRYLQGRLLGRMDAVGFHWREHANLQMLMQDVLKTSEIEGQLLDVQQVRSSLAKKLGIPLENDVAVSRYVDGIVEIMLDAVSNFNMPLTKERLWNWHAALFPTGRSGIQQIVVGAWRTKKSGRMRVVSGPISREKVHFEAPAYNRLHKEMSAFIKWFNASSTMDLIVKSAVAHFWFVTIHPFDDGNGRIARALADMLLACAEKNTQRFYSMSSQIQKERKEYYDVLESCQRGNLDITAWIQWYLNCLKRAILASEEILQVVLMKARFWEKHTEIQFNPRQRLLLNRLLEGFFGKLTSSKWAKLGKCSQDTALRDVNELLELGILEKEESGGRSTSYRLRTL